MINQIITSTVLILCILIVSAVLEKRIDPRIKYALWLLVAIKLLIPMPALKTDINVMNAVKQFETEPIEYHFIDNTLNGLPNNTQEDKNITKGDSEKGINENRIHDIGISSVCRWIWLIGTCLCAGIFVWGNLRFAMCLKKRRRMIGQYKNKIGIYKVCGITSPCLYGVCKPAIYLCEDSVLTEEQVQFVLAHEYTHYRHKDHIWAFIRCICVVLYWYNPMVWVAAYVSMRDGELACDAGTLKRIGKENHIQYGKTLVEMAANASKTFLGIHILECSTSAAGGMHEMKKRIKMIAGGPRTQAWALLLLIVISAAIAGCTFGSAANDDKANIKENANAENKESIPSGLDTAINTEEETDTQTDKEEVQNPEDMTYREAALYSEAIPDKVCIRVAPSVIRENVYYYYIPDGEEQEKLQELVSGLKIKWKSTHRKLGKRKETGWQIIYNDMVFMTFEGGYLYSYKANETEDMEYFEKNEELCGFIQTILEEKMDYKLVDITKIRDIVSAKLEVKGWRTDDKLCSQTITDKKTLALFEEWISNARYELGGTDCASQQGCLELTLAGGEVVRMSMATDSCPSFVINGVSYDYRPAEYRSTGGWYSDDFFAYFDEIYKDMKK